MGLWSSVTGGAHGRRGGQVQPRGKPGKRVYAVGDVHGRHDLLLGLLEAIEDDIANRPPTDVSLVFLGDLIDRGPQSREVIEHLLDEPPRFAHCHYIRGNHEEMFVRALSGEPRLLPKWLANGGFDCVRSYGVEVGGLIGLCADELETRLLGRIPQRHVRWMDGFADTIRFGDYLFVHAGVRPGTPIEQQDGRDLRWIRDGFLDDATDHGCVVVHGHTITAKPEPEWRPNRIGLDTGAYRTGVLTALAIEDDQQWFLQERGAPGPERYQQDASEAMPL